MNVSFQRHLPRRTFLKGLGTAVALPMLDAMIPAFARAATISIVMLSKLISARMSIADSMILVSSV